LLVIYFQSLTHPDLEQIVVEYRSLFYEKLFYWLPYNSVQSKLEILSKSNITNLVVTFVRSGDVEVSQKCGAFSFIEEYSPTATEPCTLSSEPKEQVPYLHTITYLIIEKQ
jgi:hypothetical protein